MIVWQAVALICTITQFGSYPSSFGPMGYSRVCERERLWMLYKTEAVCEAMTVQQGSKWNTDIVGVTKEVESVKCEQVPVYDIPLPTPPASPTR